RRYDFGGQGPPLQKDLRLTQRPLQFLGRSSAFAQLRRDRETAATGFAVHSRRARRSRPAIWELTPAISCRRGCRRFPWFSFPGRHGFRTTPSLCDLCRSSLVLRELAFSFRASFPFRW